jgi:hypothetical protein
MSLLLENERSFWSVGGMKAKPASPARLDPYPHTPYPPAVDRRSFLRQSLAIAGGCAVGLQAAAVAQEREMVKPVGAGRGIHARRVTWVHDAEVTDW